MSYYKTIDSGFITQIGENCGGEEIDLNEYNTILSEIHNRPTPPAGYDYRLKEDLTWELYELPPAPEEDAEPEDYEAALARLGVNV